MEFFIIKNDEQHGPFTIDQLREMGIDANTPVWHKGLDDWTLAAEIDELKDLLVYSPMPDIDVEEAAVPPQWNSHTAKAIEKKAPKTKKRRTGLWVTLGVLAALAIILTITNPKKEDHCREITSVSRTWVNETIDNFGGNNLIGGVVKTASTWLIRNAVEDNIKVDNYVLFSIGYIDTGAEKSRVSFGILGNVFTCNKEQLDEKVNEIISKYMEDAIGLGDFLSLDFDNIDDKLIDGIVDMIGDRVFGDRPSNGVAPDDSGNSSGRSDSLLDLPINEDFLREGTKMIIKEGADYLIDKVDDIGR
ncbi:MAG: DUF4339 domain-containing protein [Muribaculaceae bacterium]|nr:DUF4339 domain-containing protein [Muribaculaceae bacterium]